jgi:hypothetical protein
MFVNIGRGFLAGAYAIQACVYSISLRKRVAMVFAATSSWEVAAVCEPSTRSCSKLAAPV